MAKQYALADRMFQSNAGPSFPAHQYLISGQSAGIIGNPAGPGAWGCDTPTTQYFCIDSQTIGDLMDGKGMSWKYYAPNDALDGGPINSWQAYDAIRHIRYGPDWTTNILSATPDSTFFADISNGTLPALSWIVPTDLNSDHAGNSYPDTGPGWVSSVVNAIGTSRYWPNTVIFLTWDDWGGWYDHVAPKQIYPDGPGFRVPLLAISPYAKHGYVSHIDHELGFILHFTEETFGLPTLGTRDATSDDLRDAFDFGQPASVFKPISHGQYSTVRSTMGDY